MSITKSTYVLTIVYNLCSIGAWLQNQHTTKSTKNGTVIPMNYKQWFFTGAIAFICGWLQLWFIFWPTAIYCFIQSYKAFEAENE